MNDVNDLGEALSDSGIVQHYARLWPRAVFDCVVSGPGETKRHLARDLALLQRPGVYVLYHDDQPYYIGKTGAWLWQRLSVHSKPGARYGQLWNYFSVFVIENPEHRTLVESVLIAAVPTLNNSNPKLPRQSFPLPVKKLIRNLREVRLGDIESSEDEESGDDE